MGLFNEHPKNESAGRKPLQQPLSSPPSIRLPVRKQERRDFRFGGIWQSAAVDEVDRFVDTKAYRDRLQAWFRFP